jgi:hypothetical protein
MVAHRRIPLARAFSQWLAAVLMWGLLAPQSVWAQAPPPKVYLGDFANHKDAAKPLLVEQISRTIRDRLGASAGISLTPQLRSNGGLNPAIAEAVKHYEAGRAHYVAQHYSDAAASFTQALFHFEKNAADIKDWKMVETLLFRLASSQFQAGDAAGGEETIARLLAFNTEFALPSEDLPQTFKDRFVAVQAAHKKLAPGKLDTRSVNPTGAEVWVNGKVRSVTPVEVANVAPGSHFIVLRKDGASAGLYLKVEPGKTVEVQATLSETSAESQSPEGPLRDALRGGVVSDALRQALQEMADRAAVRFVVVGLVVNGNTELRAVPVVFDREEKTLRILKSTSFDRDLLNLNVNAYQTTRDIAAALRDPALGQLVAATDSPDIAAVPAAVAVVTPDKTPPVKTPPDKTPPDKTPPDKTPPNRTNFTKISDPIDEPVTGPTDDGSWYTNPWVWTGITAGVAAVVITTLAITMSSDDDGNQNPGFNATISW